MCLALNRRTSIHSARRSVTSPRGLPNLQELRLQWALAGQSTQQLVREPVRDEAPVAARVPTVSPWLARKLRDSLFSQAEEKAASHCDHHSPALLYALS